MFARKDSAGSNKHTEPSARILVVEDDFVVAGGIERALSDAGFDVAGVAASADEAVELAESQKPSLIVMDVRLAGELDGIRAEARESGPSLLRHIMIRVRSLNLQCRLAGYKSPIP
jgi:two-component system, response regulator PdtaR